MTATKLIPSRVAATLSDAAAAKFVRFIQFDDPPLKDDEYTLTVTQTTNTVAPNTFETSRNFAIRGERFTFKSGELASVYPPHLANGEFDGVLANVVFTRGTLPWERYLTTDRPEVPWLAVFLFNADQKPTLEQRTARDLVPDGQRITVQGNDGLTDIGTLPSNTLSYPTINPLAYGERPDEACITIDIDLATFNLIAPSINDMGYLAHIRELDTTDAVQNGDESTRFSIVLANRIAAADGQPSYACLVSLEDMGIYLPDDEGTPANFPNGIEKVRLLCYRSWQFTANTLGEDLRQLLEGLNGPAINGQQFTTLQLPVPATLTPPTPDQVQAALSALGNGKLDSNAAKVLGANAVGMGYVPMNAELRHGDTTVSWYRGPLSPYLKTQSSFSHALSPDACNRYDPYAGMFDASYSAAWQLGRLMALQNKTFSTALFNWKRSVNVANGYQAEIQSLQQALGFDERTGQGNAFVELNRRRQARRRIPAQPRSIDEWLAKLRLLHGVPFQYLVPHEDMLPLESMRFFHLDPEWIDYLIDGVVSIGLDDRRQTEINASLFQVLKDASDPRKFNFRRRRKGQRYVANDAGNYSGLLLRSKIVSGWPNLPMNGYAAVGDETSEVHKIRMDRLSPDCMICIFDGVVQQVVFHEPPEQLRCGVQIGVSGGPPYAASLREISGEQPGIQYLNDPKGGLPLAEVQMRDGRTIRVSDAATSIWNKLKNDFQQTIPKFTSAEFALEMAMGALKVDFNKK